MTPQTWNLTKREAEVLCAMAAVSDCNSKRAARTLGLSHRTVEEYVQRAMRKMNVSTRLQALLKWDRDHRACARCLTIRLATATSEGMGAPERVEEGATA